MDVLSSLQVIDRERICLHEDHEASRLTATCEALNRDGVLRHPPLAMQIRDGRCLILDGAHRTAALSRLGCRWIPVQVANPSDLELGAWDHIVPVGAWWDQLRQDPSLRWEPLASDERPLAEVLDAAGNRLYLYPASQPEGVIGMLSAWHRVVGSYSRRYPVQRVPQGADTLPDDGTVRLRYPVMTVGELEEIVCQGQVMPAGVTRFVISGRLLNLRIPLAMLQRAAFNHAEWEEHRTRWQRSLRLYAESVYLCEA